MIRPEPSAGFVVAVAAAFWAVVLAASAIGTTSGDVRGLYVLGTRFVHPPELEEVHHWEGTGYDGQFFAALAVDPFLLHAETPRFLDVPSYRAGRIGLPLVAWLVSFGDRRAALLAYPFLAWTLGLLGIWIAARWLEDDGRSAAWAAPLALSVGMVSSMLRCLPDAAAVSIVLLALWLDRRGRSGSVLALSFAVLVRETSWLGAAALAAVRWRQRRRREAALALLAPAGVAILWRAYVLGRPGFAPHALVGLGWPLGWLPGWTGTAAGTSWAGRLAMVAVLAAILAVLALRRPWQAAALTYAGFAFLAIVLDTNVYDDVWSFARVLAAIPFLAAVLPGGRAIQGVPTTFAFAGAALLVESSWVGRGLAILLGK